MPLVINTNVQSLNAQRQLVKSGADLARAQERLASGLRINKAADDAAGLAISNRLTSQVRGLNQAVRNANDGVSMIQTAEGGLNEITNMLQRMRELAIQSANGIYSDADRATLNAEVQQLKTEVQRIADTTSFNGQALLDGSLGEVALQIGSQAFQTVSVNIAEVSNEKLGVAATAGASSYSQTDLTTNLNGLGTGDLTINGVAIEAAKSADDTSSSHNKTSSALSIAAAINAQADLTGVEASVGQTTLGGAAMTVAAVSTTLSINGVSIGTLNMVATDDLAAKRAETVDLINSKADLTGVRAVDSGSDNGGISLVADDGRNIAVSAGTAAAADNFGIAFGQADGTVEVTTGAVSLRSRTGSDITIGQGATGNAEDAGFSVGTYSGVQAQVSSDLNNSTTAMSAGDVKINGVIIGASLAAYDTASSASNAASAIAKAAAINLVSDQTGVTAEVRENVATNAGVQVFAGAAVSGTVNGVAITGFTSTAGAANAALNRQALVDAVNAISGQTGVRAVDTGENGTANGGGVILIADDGRNIVTNFTNGEEGGVVSGAQTFTGEFTLVSDKEIVVERGTTANIANSGLKVGTYGNAEDGISVANIDVSTEEGAQTAIKGLDNAIDAVNATRADLGAINNRLDFAVANLQNASENTAAARSRIQDADFAAETANLSRAQVLQQASTAILAQANAAPQQVLSLLQ